MPQAYGDFVTNTTMGAYSYGESGEGFTPNVAVEYIGDGGDGLDFWTTGYGDLVNIVENEDNGERWTIIRFAATLGCETVLHSLDMGNYIYSPIVIDSITVTNESGAVLFQTNNFTLGANAADHTHINFGSITGQVLTLVLDLQTAAITIDNDKVGLDNITFSQIGTAIVPNTEAFDGAVPAILGVDGTESDPDIYIIGLTNAYTRNYGVTPLIVGWNGLTGGSYGSDGRSYVQLYIQNGSTVISGDGSSVGEYYNKSDRLVRLTDASTWTVGGTLNCPSAGNNDKLEVFSGSLVSCSTLSIGGNSTGDGEVVVSNANSRIVVSGNIAGGAIDAYSEMTLVDHALLQVGGSSIDIDYVNLNGGFIAWAGDHTSENSLFVSRGWDGAAWQVGLNVTETYYATDAETKLATSDPDSGFAGYDGLGGYTLYTASVPSEEIVEVWSARGDFSLISNPNGEWSYGAVDAVSFSNFSLGTLATNASTWVTRTNDTGWIWVNSESYNQSGVEPGWLSLHPGYLDVPDHPLPTAVRWTAPAFSGIGTIHLVGRFLAGDSGIISTTVRHNTLSLWDGIAGEFDMLVTVEPGDTIDFVVWGNFDYGNTPLDAAIELTYTEQSTNTLTVVSAHGSPVPAIGPNTVIDGSIVACSVDSVTSGTTNYSPVGWTLTGQEPASGTTNWFELTFTTNATLTWNWQTNYWLDVTVSGSGSVDGVDGFYAADSEQTLTANPAADWLFMGWQGDASGTNSATVAMDAPKAILAVFSDDADDDGLTNAEEVGLGSNPWKKDTDDDGFDDAFEVAQGLNVTNNSSAVVDYIANKGTTFGLYPSNAVLDVAVGQMLLETVGNQAVLQLQLEESDDLVTWTNAGPPEVWNWPVDGDKKFFRVRSY